MTLKLALRKKDKTLKLWFDYAKEEDINVSFVIAKAVEYHIKTKEYLQIGTIGDEISIDDKYKNIYYSEDSFLECQIKEWKEKGIHPSTEVKRIMRRGIKATGIFTVVSETDAYDAVADVGEIQKEPVKRLHNNSKERQWEKPVQDTETKTEKKEYTKPSNSSNNSKPKKDFVMSLIADGCGLGED